MRKLVQTLLGRCGYELRRLPNGAASRDSNGSARIGNYDLVIPPRNPLGHEYAKNPEYMSQLTRLVSAMSRAGSEVVFVDVGANIGDTLALAASGGTVRAICVEGDAKTFGVLQQNARTFPNTRLVNAFLSDAVSEERVTIRDDGWNATLCAPDSTDAQSVRMTTLDTIIGDAGIPSGRCVLKVDVEGYEPKVLAGATQLLARSHPVLLIEYNSDALALTGLSGKQMLESLLRHGYGSALVYENNGVFMMATDISEASAIAALESYCSHPARQVPYVDLILFHKSHEDFFENFRRSECERKPALKPS